MLAICHRVIRLVTDRRDRPDGLCDAVRLKHLPRLSASPGSSVPVAAPPLGHVDVLSLWCVSPMLVEARSRTLDGHVSSSATNGAACCASTSRRKGTVIRADGAVSERPTTGLPIT